MASSGQDSKTQALATPHTHQLSENIAAGLLETYEVYWRDHYSWLQDCGYLLRPRYSPDWSPPWLGNTTKTPADFEEGVKLITSTAIDAARISDGSYVILKRCDPSDISLFPGVVPEVHMFEKLASEPLVSDPKNHCVSPIEIIHVPKQDSEEVLIVLPLLYEWVRFPFSTIGEAVSFFSQTFEGLQFLHNNNIWHGSSSDCKYNNLLMDASPIFRDDPHPWRPERIQDFSRAPRPARIHDPSAGPPLVDLGYGGTYGVPEWGFLEQRCNPFPVDVWCLGNMIHGHFTEGYALLGKQKNKRPSVKQAIRSTKHWATQLYFMVKRIPAIPTP
ncbi:hypothetical protein DFH09DRAFT_1095431 [Mycena vulgaris]|nr:hypothetical protein DFH09DRAFT_1095431 [Mycena vulgaris]